MPTTCQTGAAFRIIVIAASPAASLAILSIAGHLGIEPRQAAIRLATLPSTLADRVAAPEAQRLQALLAALGLTVRLDPDFSDLGTPQSAETDLALQPVGGMVPAGMAERLATKLALPLADVSRRLSQPGGLVLAGLNVQRAERVRRMFRRDRTLRTVMSMPDAAEYDLFAPHTRGLMADVMRLGLGPCRFSHAVAGGMNRATARHLARRAGPGALVLCRAFQRFDLMLHAAPGFEPAELADYLATRPGADMPPSCGVTAAAPLRIETDLPRRAAEQFAADYAVMGLEVRARLCGILSV